MDLTIDELSELEEAIADACAEKRREGWTITPRVTFVSATKKCCPVGALQNNERLSGEPMIALSLGFDGCTFGDHTGIGWKPWWRPYFDMGIRFRERLEAGEL